MTVERKSAEPDPRVVDPELLSVLLERAGWRLVGGKAGEYSRFGVADGEAREDVEMPRLLIPLNKRNADYNELLGEAVSQLRSWAKITPALVKPVLDRLDAAPGDELRFRKSTTTIRGAVPWLIGEDLYASARGMLVAGAKSRMKRMPYFGQSNGTFAKRFLDSVLMGQTQVGSYVVTAFAPPEREFPEQVKRDGTESLVGYSGREIVQSLAAGLAATEEALDHYASTNSMSGFEEGVRSGISRELTQALHGMVVNSDAADVSIEWAPSIAPMNVQVPAVSRFEFTGGVADTLRRASERLAKTTPTQYVQVMGWPSVVAKPNPGGAGLISLRVRRGSEARTLRVRLDESQFEIAAEAIGSEHGIGISGRQEKEGNRYWLYDATNVQLVDLTVSKRRRDEPVPSVVSKDQLSLFSDESS